MKIATVATHSSSAPFDGSDHGVTRSASAQTNWRRARHSNLRPESVYRRSDGLSGRHRSTLHRLSLVSDERQPRASRRPLEIDARAELHGAGAAGAKDLADAPA